MEAGSTFCAVATSKHSLRIFSVSGVGSGDAQAFTCMESNRMIQMTVTIHEFQKPQTQDEQEGHCWMLGVQTGVMTLAGRPVAMAAQEDQLAVVWHTAMPAAEGDQALHYSVYCVSAQSVLHTGALYLSGGSHLSWLGFSETGLLAAYDTQVRLSR